MSTNQMLSQPTTKERDSGPALEFTQSVLPWLVAAGALILYLLTLNRWISFSNLAHVAKVSGWTWHPELMAPLYMIVTYPFRWLPPAYVPLGLNLFAAVCAALVLALLARSVALLPHDRTVAQREKERGDFALLSIRPAWAPVLLAVLVCGLQLSFWENATAAGTSPGLSTPSGHMFDLLVFAYVVRSLLEYRVSERDSWLARAAFLVGLSMTNDWAMIGYLPLFVFAVIWIKGVGFFNAQFLTRMFLWGIAGLALYLFLPFVYAFFANPEVPFLYSLKFNLGTQFYVLKSLLSQRNTLLLFACTSLLPVLFMGIRWSSQFGDTSRTGAALAKIVVHVFHGFFLIACVWVALDPPFSPRNQNLGVPFLSFYYLGALAVGYMTGYFLLVFGSKRTSRFARYVPGYVRLLNNAVTLCTWVIVILAPIALLMLNLPRIRMANGPIFRQYAAAVADQLPQGPALIMSDDPVRMVIIQSELADEPKAKEYIFLVSSFLKVPAFHSYLARRHPQRWPAYLGTDQTREIDAVRVIDLLANMAATNKLYYLHPSFGYYFEVFYPEPHGIVSELQLYRTNSAVGPVISDELVKQNQEFWAKLKPGILEPLAGMLAPTPPGAQPTLTQILMKKAHVKQSPHPAAVQVATYYSQALNFWGTQLQTRDRFEEAIAAFALAQEMNPDNVVAKVNEEYTRQYLAGNRRPLTISKNLEEAFGKYGTWERVLQNNGPYAEPGFCFGQGQLFDRGANYRQAAQQYLRARSLYPEHGPATLSLANLYVARAMPKEALALMTELQSLPSFATQLTNLPGTVQVHSAAHLANADPASAQAVVATALQRVPAGETNLTAYILEGALRSFVRYAAYTNALPLIERLIVLRPDDPDVLATKGYLCIQLGKYKDALAPLTEALKIKTTNDEFLASTHLNRGIASFQTGDLQAAQTDYEFVLKSFKNAPQAYFGLGEIAFRKGDTNAALKSYQTYLQLVPEDTEDAKSVRAKIEQLTR